MDTHQITKMCEGGLVFMVLALLALPFIALGYIIKLLTTDD
jgi:hypothetical protein